MRWCHDHSLPIPLPPPLCSCSTEHPARGRSLLGPGPLADAPHRPRWRRRFFPRSGWLQTSVYSPLSFLFIYPPSAARDRTHACTPAGRAALRFVETEASRCAFFGVHKLDKHEIGTCTVRRRTAQQVQYCSGHRRRTLGDGADDLCRKATLAQPLLERPSE